MLGTFVNAVVRRGDARLGAGNWATRRGDPRVARLFGPTEPDTAEMADSAMEEADRPEGSDREDFGTSL